jgi:ribonuclease HII|tara:strand:+ start:22 stop:294 length:273 start_codon:yes stop_codon:yes gene_type:complete
MSEVKTMELEDKKTITPEQLENVKRLQTELQQHCANIGGLEVQKAKVIYQVNMLENEMEEVKKAIEEEYGPININLVDGSYEKVEVEAKE